MANPFEEVGAAIASRVSADRAAWCARADDGSVDAADAEVAAVVRGGGAERTEEEQVGADMKDGKLTPQGWWRGGGTPTPPSLLGDDAEAAAAGTSSALAALDDGKAALDEADSEEEEEEDDEEPPPPLPAGVKVLKDGRKAYDIPPFKPEEQLGPMQRIAVVGKSGSGKSKFLIRNVLWHLRNKVDTVISYVPTARNNGDPDVFVPDAFNLDRFDAKHLTSVMTWAEMRSMQAAEGSRPRKLMPLIVIDDCNAETNEKGKRTNIFGSPAVFELHKQGRHHGLGVVSGLQCVMDAVPDVRKNLSMFMTLATSNLKEIEEIWKQWFSHMDKAKWRDVFNKCTAPHPNKALRRALVIDNDKISPSTNPYAGLFVWEVPIITTPFLVGRAEHYALSRRYKVKRAVPVLDPFQVGGKAKTALPLLTGGGGARGAGGVLTVAATASRRRGGAAAAAGAGAAAKRGGKDDGRDDEIEVRVQKPRATEAAAVVASTKAAERDAMLALRSLPLIASTAASRRKWG